MATQQPSFLEPQPRYDPIIDKDKFEKELVSISCLVKLVCAVYHFRMTSLIKLCNLLKYLLKKNTLEVSFWKLFLTLSNCGTQLSILLVMHPFFMTYSSMEQSCIHFTTTYPSIYSPGAIISTWREKGCNTLWKCIRNHPLDRANVVCYKSCYLIHKMLRDGYPDVSHTAKPHPILTNY